MLNRHKTLDKNVSFFYFGKEKYLVGRLDDALFVLLKIGADLALKEAQSYLL